jgi:hypothetical protein
VVGFWCMVGMRSWAGGGAVLFAFCLVGVLREVSRKVCGVVVLVVRGCGDGTA